MKGKKTLLRLVPAVLCLLLALGSVTLFSACGQKEDGSWMRCHQAQELVMWISLGTGALLAAGALVKRRSIETAASALGTAGGIICFLIPGSMFPLCMMHTMRCYTHLQPFVRIMGALIAVCCLISLILSLRDKGEKR